MILDQTISIQRLTPDTDNPDKEQYQTNAALAAVACNLQPAGPEQTAISDGVFGQTYLCFTTESGVKTGDKITISGTNEVMRVKGIEDWSADPLSHYELTLVRFEEEEV